MKRIPFLWRLCESALGWLSALRLTNKLQTKLSLASSETTLKRDSGMTNRVFHESGNPKMISTVLSKKPKMR